MARAWRFFLLPPLALASSALAQSVVRNPGFTSDLSSWTVDGAAVSAAWNPLDAASLPGSGSAALLNGAASARTGGSISQCLALTPGLVYPARLVFRVPSGQTATGSVRAGVDLFASGGCTGTPVASYSYGSAVGTTFDTWIGLVIGDVAPPPGVSSALVTLAVTKEQAGGSFRVLFDDVTIGPLQTLTVPASASIHGANGAFFHTDLWVVNTSLGQAQALRLRHRCFQGQACAGGEQVALVNARSSRLFSDVLASLFGDGDTAGAVEVSYESAVGRPTVLSRTYSPSLPDPTTGSALPGLAASQASTRTVLAGLAAAGGSTTTGFRTNAGVYNPSGASVTVTLELYGGNGALLGSLSRVLGPREPLQVNDVFAAAGAPALLTTSAYAVVTAAAPVFSYATVIDNQSGDSLIVLGEP